MRILTAARLAAFALLASGCRDEPENISPFAIFSRPDMAAGIRFSTMEAWTKPPAIEQFTCEDLWAGGRQCSIRIDPGTLIATVNRRGRVVRLKIETRPLMRGSSYDGRTQVRIERASREFRFTRETWDLVTPAVDSARERGSAALYWIDPQAKWSGGMWYRSLYTYLPEHWKEDMPKYQDTLAYLPDSVVTTDELAFREFMEQRPPEPLLGPPDTPVERLRFDLAMVASAQAEHFETHGSYASTADVLLFAAGEGVHVEIREATTVGWAAVGTHDAAPGVMCVIHAGTVATPPRTPGAAAAPPGEVACGEG